jgi:hypothetical protein
MSDAPRSRVIALLAAPVLALGVSAATIGPAYASTVPGLPGLGSVTSGLPGLGSAGSGLPGLGSVTSGLPGLGSVTSGLPGLGVNLDVQVYLQGLGLGIEDDNGYIAANGPAAVVNLAASTLGALGDGTDAFFSGSNETGNGTLAVVGNSDTPLYFELGHSVQLSMCDYTNQVWSISDSAGDATDASLSADQCQNISPTDALFTNVSPPDFSSSDTPVAYVHDS